MEHSHRGEQGIHTQAGQELQGIRDRVDMLERDIAQGSPVAIVVPVVLDMEEVAAHPVAASVLDNPASVVHIHCSVEQESYVFPVVVALQPLARVGHMVSKPGETPVPPMDRRVKHYSHVHDA